MSVLHSIFGITQCIIEFEKFIKRISYFMTLAWISFSVFFFHSKLHISIEFSQQVVDFCEELYTSGVRSPFLLAFLVDLYQEKRLNWDEQHTDGDNNEDGSNPKELEEKVAELCNQLISTHDTIRAKYWEYILLKFQLKLAQKNKMDHESNSEPNPNAAE